MLLSRTPPMGLLAVLAALAAGHAALAGCGDWEPIASPSTSSSFSAAVAARNLHNASLDALLQHAVASDCPSSEAVLRGAVVRLRSAAGDSGGGGQCSWQLQSARGRPVCRLQVTLLALRLPCGQGALRVGGELLCGGHLGSRTVSLPAPSRNVPVLYTSVAPSADDFDALVRLEECEEAEGAAEARAVSDRDCGGLYPATPGEAVGLLSPGYPARYPHNKHCLFVLRQREQQRPACFVDVEFVDFNLASPARGCAAGDRLVVEGVDLDGAEAAFCGSRSGITRLPLRQDAQKDGGGGATLRFLSDGESSATGFRVLATLIPCAAVGVVHDVAVEGDGVGNRSASLGVPGFPSPGFQSPGFPSPGFPYPAAQPPQCCGRVHAGVQLFITSPGFPTGLGLADCVFPVARWSPQTCRVRLVLHHFLLLGSLAACDKHFLEVDGRRLCGCQSRAQFVSYFRVDEAVKQFRYFRHPLVTGAFMVEVIQEDCSGPFGAMGGPPFRGGWPARSTDGRATWSVGNVTSDIKRWGQVRFPEAGSHSGLTKTLPKGSGDWGSEYPQQGPQYPQQGPQDFLPGAQYPQPPQYPQQGPHDFLPGAQYPQQGPQYPQQGPQDFLPGAQYPQQGPQYPQQGPQDFLPGAQYPQQGPQDFLPGAQYPQQGPQYPQQGPQYPQPGSQYPTQPSDQGPHAIPEDGVDSSCCLDADLPQSLDAGRSAALGVLPTCGAPSYKDWMAGAAAWAQTVPSALVQCPVGIFPLAKCRKLEGLNGFFATPRYPDLYPNNARICYRILRYPEQCGVQMTFLDFDLEPSPACNKDYVSLGGSSRYCGSTLLSTTLYLSFESSLYIDILFVTDNAVSARGFRASFRQVACGAPGVIGGQGPGPFPSSIPGPVQGGVSDVVPLYPGGLPGGVPGGAPAISPGFFPGSFLGRTPGVGPSIFPGAIPSGVSGGPPIGVPAIGAGAYPGGFPTIGYPGPVPGAYPEYGPPYRPRPVPVSEEGPYQASGQPERPPVLPDYPRYPEPTTPAPAPPPPRTPPPPITVCGGDVRQQQFALSLRDVFSHPECVFTVRRVSQDICGLQVRVERMGLDCQREHLVVGDRTLCGADLVGQTVMVDFFGDAVQILYQGEASAQGDFFVHLQQVADCLELDVTPVARFGKAAPDDVATPATPTACVAVLDAAHGVILAPSLEPRPPHDLACSYLFRRRPGRCALRLQFHDFALATGPDCRDSYLALRNHKYCEADLRGTSHGLTFGSSSAIEVPYRLRKDVAFARWNASYSQLPC